MLCLIPKLKIWDIPQERSAHTHPTPKGGGIAIIAGFFSGHLSWYLCHQNLALPPKLLEAWFAILWLSLFSLLDDIRSQNVWLKLIVQIFSAYLAMLSLMLSFPLTLILTVICVVLLNTINFMDGLNGLASLSIMIASAFLLKANAPISICLPLIVALVCFLPWNFPKARIFMGDVGSQSCALILCLTAGLLISQNRSQDFNIRIIILLPCLLNGMIFDVFWTLFDRYRTGERLTEAHNTHLYQLAARSKYFSSVLIVFIECCFVLWGGCVALYAPLRTIFIFLLIPQIVWLMIVLHFWKISQATLK